MLQLALALGEPLSLLLSSGEQTAICFWIPLQVLNPEAQTHMAKSNDDAPCSSKGIGLFGNLCLALVKYACFTRPGPKN